MSDNIKISKWDTAEFLESGGDIDIYIQVDFESGDPKQITKALGNAAKARGVAAIAAKSGLTREHLYTSLSENGNPARQTLIKIMDTFGYQFSVMSKTNSHHTM